MKPRPRTPEIMADAAYAIFTRAGRECTGNFFIDDELARGRPRPLPRRTDGSEEDLVPDFFC